LNAWCDAVVVRVHFDDGTDKPYYTIRYSRFEADGDSIKLNPKEKQTTGNRLQPIPDEENPKPATNSMKGSKIEEWTLNKLEQSYFSRRKNKVVHRKGTGCSPKMWRRMVQNRHLIFLLLKKKNIGAVPIILT